MLKGSIPNNEDWENVRCFITFLKIFFDITQKVPGSKHLLNISMNIAKYYKHFRNG